MALHPVTHYDRPFDPCAPGGDDHIKMFKISSADYSQRPAKKQIDQSESKALQQVDLSKCNQVLGHTVLFPLFCLMFGVICRRKDATNSIFGTDDGWASIGDLRGIR